jgi:hypothetical protein
MPAPCPLAFISRVLTDQREELAQLFCRQQLASIVAPHVFGNVQFQAFTPDASLRPQFTLQVSPESLDSAEADDRMFRGGESIETAPEHDGGVTMPFSRNQRLMIGPRTQNACELRSLAERQDVRSDDTVHEIEADRREPGPHMCRGFLRTSLVRPPRLRSM